MTSTLMAAFPVPAQAPRTLLPDPRQASPAPAGGREAVVNPAKFQRTGELSRFRAEVDDAFAELRWSSPLWLFTTAATCGTDQAQEAVAAGLDVVLVAGGDGTICTVAKELAGSAVPLGILPAGTGNLLARNLGVPLGGVAAAVRIGGQGTDCRLDIGRLELDRTGRAPTGRPSRSWSWLGPVSTPP